MRYFAIEKLTKIFVSISSIVLFLVTNIFLSNYNFNESKFDKKNYNFIEFSNLNKIAQKYCSNDDVELSPINHKQTNPSFGPNYDHCEFAPYQCYERYDRVTYFEKLFRYSPENYESCGFVSLIQMLSFYDTFFNDSVIPESFEDHETSATTLSESKDYSPGTRKIIMNDEFNPINYYVFCHQNVSDSLSCYLTVLYNTLNVTNIPLLFKSFIQGYEFQSLLNAFYGNSNTCVVNRYTNQSQSNFKNIAKAIIDSGHPVIVGLYDSSHPDEDGHYVVAYRYSNDVIYANFGWGSEHTNMNIFASDFDRIDELITLDFSNLKHLHSNNYIINNIGYCGCNFEDDVYLKNATLYRNISPTLYWCRNTNDLNESFTLTFMESVDDVLFSINTIYNQITLSDNHWSSLFAYTNGHVYVTLTRHSYLWDSSKTIILTLPTQNFTSLTLLPTDYGFANAYPTDSSVYDNYLTHFLPNGVSFRTRRYRTGYIHYEYVVMSCIKTGITESYIEYAFNTPISDIYVDLSHWSTLQSELLDSSNGVAELQVWHEKDPLDPDDTSRWVRKVDLLSSAIDLPRDRTNPECYDFYFDSGTYCFRFYCAINNPITSDRNKGRICIGDMTIHFAV